jgi:hypothetical protein
MGKRTNLFAALLLCSGSASALDYEWNDINFTLNSRFTVGAAIRMQQHNYDLIGKTNVPGQQDLCTRDSCISLSGDPEPNARLVKAVGAFSGVNGDDGNINYDQYDLVAASNRLSSDLMITHGDYLARVRGILFYDPVNADFDERHNDQRFQPARSPRSKQVESIYANGFDLYDAYVQSSFELGERRGILSVGYQTVRWGESTLIARNAIAEINAPNSAVLHTPGFEINEVFRPTASVLLSAALTDRVSTELFYQLKWRPVQADPAGSFFSDMDLLDGPYAIIGLGQMGEDPNKLQRANGPISLVSSTSLTVYPDAPNEPRDQGQYGMRLNYYADWNGGTEISLYYLNYHSRYPYATVTATDASCTRGVGPDGVTNDTDHPNTTAALLDCKLFNGSLLGRENEHNRDREPVPIDTMGFYLDYPEDIRMFGLSFNTTALGMSFAGEYSFRPNLPLQVNITDIVQAGLQPAFPSNDFLIDPTSLLNLLYPEILQPLTPDLLENLVQLASARFPGANTAVPSYLKTYRGYGAIQPHQVIPGYERLHVGQLDLTAIKAFSTNPFGADQILVITEVGFTQIYNMPSISELQLETGYPDRTHASIGQDEKGPREFATLNPKRQTDGFADDFAWGMRAIIMGEYNNLLFGWTFKPQITLHWDIKGTAPYPIQNFVEGRKQYDIGTTVNVTEDFSARINYQVYTGGGRHNTLKDRDNLALSFAYAF